MTIECMCCHMILGVKCQKCGGPAVIYAQIFPHGIRSFTERRAICRVQACMHLFEPGEGGITSGICEECSRRLLAAHEDSRSLIPVSKFQIPEQAKKKCLTSASRKRTLCSRGLPSQTRDTIRIGALMPYTPEFRCAECDQPLEAQITIDGRLLIQLCPTCKVRLLLNLPDREPEPETMEVRE